MQETKLNRAVSQLNSGFSQESKFTRELDLKLFEKIFNLKKIGLQKERFIRLTKVLVFICDKAINLI